MTHAIASEHAPEIQQLGTLKLTLLISAFWTLLWLLAGLQEQTAHASLWFPPAALSFAAFLVFGLRAFPGIVLAIVVTTFMANSMYGIQQDTIGFIFNVTFGSLAHAVMYWLVAYALRELITEVKDSPTYVVIGFLSLAIAATAGATYVGIESLIATGAIYEFMRPGMFIPRWLGDLVAVTALSPLFILLLSRFNPTLRVALSRRIAMYPRTSVKAGLLKGITLCVFLFLLLVLIRALGTFEATFIIFILLIPMMWITATESLYFVTGALALLSLVMTFALHMLQINEYTIVYNTAIGIISATTWFALSLSAQSRGGLSSRD